MITVDKVTSRNSIGVTFVCAFFYLSFPQADKANVQATVALLESAEISAACRRIGIPKSFQLLLHALPALVPTT